MSKVCHYLSNNNIVINILVLKSVNQPSLAYLTAATHGLDEDARQLRDELESRGQTVPPIDPNARLLVPPPPIQQMTENWPLLMVSRGPFDAQLVGATNAVTLGGVGGGTKAGVGKAARAAAAFAAQEDNDTVR